MKKQLIDRILYKTTLFNKCISSDIGKCEAIFIENKRKVQLL
jgi:hypothetical protein